jgi:RNA recognition motif-containing protein
MDIYVGNLSFNLEESELEALFTPYGTVSEAKIISDKYSGKSKGFGFVNMNDVDQAQAAITALNGSLLNDRSLVVNEARPKKQF